MNEETNETFRGHYKECIEHLAASISSCIPKGSKEAAQIKEPIADFCEVKTDSVMRWLNGSGSLPIGKQLIKLMCFLDMNDYRVIELERMTRVNRNFVELIGYKVLPFDQAYDLIGYNSTSTFYQVLFGNFGISKERVQKMWRVWKERKNELDQMKSNSQNLYRLDIHISSAQRSQAQETQETITQDVLYAQNTEQATISIMKGLSLLLDEYHFSSPSNGNLQSLRQSADTILKLSAQLSALSSHLITSDQKEVK